ncbi:MAG: LamG-like jellyroll fold domain-containing protein, partial [Verrucomicrobiota bacterium]
MEMTCDEHSPYAFDSRDGAWDGTTWVNLGQIGIPGAPYEVDIDPFVAPGQAFRFVRLTDDGLNTYGTAPEPGFDVDAIAAITLSSGGTIPGLVAHSTADDGGRTLEDFVWQNDWRYAGDLVGNVVFTNLTRDLLPDDGDSDGDGMPDWWETLHALDPGADDSLVDTDNDGLSNYTEYLAGTDPNDIDTDNDTTLDGNEDSDGDTLSNVDEQNIFGTDPGNWDTDDDGYSDGAEVVNWEPNPVDAFGIGPQHSGATDPLSPRVHRSLVMSGKMHDIPFDGRFNFIMVTNMGSNVVLNGPEVTINNPQPDAQLTERFVTVDGVIDPSDNLQSARIFINDILISDLNVDASGAFSITVIIGVGANEITVVATDNDGLIGETSLTVNGNFALAGLRVTQTWNTPGDLDTWLVDPMRRHMGWTVGGPGFPQHNGMQIPGAMLDIDSISGTGPENITVEDGQTIDGDYEVWINNFSHSGNPQTTVRVLVNEGAPNERLVEFGPMAAPTPGGNSGNAANWQLVTTVTMPDGNLSPSGRDVGVTQNVSNQIFDVETGLASFPGFTIEAWVNPSAAGESGNIMTFISDYDGLANWEVGLDNGAPFMNVRASGGTVYTANGGALPLNRWTHVAYVWDEFNQSVRVHINGALTVAQEMTESRIQTPGKAWVDAAWNGNVFANVNVDELRLWSRARSGGLIAANIFEIIQPSATLVAGYSFDDGGLGIGDSVHPLDSDYNMGSPADAVAPIGHNDCVTASSWAPVFGIIDSDDDGLPDWWEQVFFGDPEAAEPGEDPDEDGLGNLHEYWAQTNPHDLDSDNDGHPDNSEDLDGDGLVEGAEQDTGADPRLADTDDDGVSDAAEFAGLTSPNNSLEPLIDRVLDLTSGGPNCYVELRHERRFALPSFTVEAWVNMTGFMPDGRIITREVEAGNANYTLGVAFGRPYISFSASDWSGDVTLVATPPYSLSAWHSWPVRTRSPEEVPLPTHGLAHTDTPIQC